MCIRDSCILGTHLHRMVYVQADWNNWFFVAVQKYCILHKEKLFTLLKMVGIWIHNSTAKKLLPISSYVKSLAAVIATRFSLKGLCRIHLSVMLEDFMFYPLISSMLQPLCLLPVAKYIWKKYLACSCHCVEVCHIGSNLCIHKYCKKLCVVLVWHIS